MSYVIYTNRDQFFCIDWRKTFGFRQPDMNKINENTDMETIDLKKTDLQKAYNDGCDEVKQTLKTLYPDFQFERVLPKTGDE